MDSDTVLSLGDSLSHFENALGEGESFAVEVEEGFAESGEAFDAVTYEFANGGVSSPICR